MRNEDIPRLMYRPEEAAEALAVGRTRIYAALASGELRSVRVGRSRRIPADALHEYAESLATA
jgi:excisionase family DNA binding protein